MINWRQFAAAMLLVPLVAFAACSKGKQPLKLTAAQSNYIGVWEHVGEAPDDRDGTDNMLLVINPDSTIFYVHCVDHEHSHQYVSLGDGYIHSLTDKELGLVSNVLFMHVTDDLSINRHPYVENGENYFDVEGLKLRRLGANESSSYKSWKCQKEKE